MARIPACARQSGSAALEALEQLKLRDAPVAFFLVDQRMPLMTGVEFSRESSRAEYPDAKRALLTAYADTEAAIRAINQIKLDYYLMKPWDPPDQNLYPVLDELLSDWQASFRPSFEGARVLGHRWAPLTHQIKDFMARNRIPYHWSDLETDERVHSASFSLSTCRHPNFQPCSSLTAPTLPNPPTSRSPKRLAASCMLLSRSTTS